MRPRGVLRKAQEGTLFRKIEQAQTDGTRAERKLRHEEPQEAVDFCLNCTRKKCGGDCTMLKRFKIENEIGNKYKTGRRSAFGRDARLYAYMGREYTAQELACIADVSAGTMRVRLRQGISPEEAVAIGNLRRERPKKGGDV